MSHAIDAMFGHPNVVGRHVPPEQQLASARVCARAGDVDGAAEILEQLERFTEGYVLDPSIHLGLLILAHEANANYHRSLLTPSPIMALGCLISSGVRDCVAATIRQVEMNEAIAADLRRELALRQSHPSE